LLAAVTNGTAAALESVPGITTNIMAAVADSAKTANAGSYQLVYLSSLAFGGVSIIAAFFAKPVDMYLTSFVNKTIGGPTTKESKAVKEGEIA
jgi:Fungal trichothecene efflux pump (TRI12)